tara:strand:+ start:327 stop:629 length:303 start_codon:yes stop_codon:yes gene_type:complete
MIVFWSLYFLISISIAFLSINFFKNILLKSLAFSLILAILTTVWFKSPGEIVFAPVLSIFLLESSILENNGLSRIFRPIGMLTIFYFAISYALLKRHSKN